MIYDVINLNEAKQCYDESFKMSTNGANDRAKSCDVIFYIRFL